LRVRYLHQLDHAFVEDRGRRAWEIAIGCVAGEDREALPGGGKTPGAAFESVMIFGPETWREVRGVAFTYWDRWLLRLAADDPNGMAGVVQQLEVRRKQQSFYQDDAEAKLAQVADLAARLERLHVEPRDVLGDAGHGRQEAESQGPREGLRADRRAAHPDHARHATAAPSTAIHARSLDFPVSPSRFESELLSHVGGQNFLDGPATGCLSDAIESIVDDAVLSLSDDAERLAMYRAAMTVIVESMERVDDSLADMATTFSKIWESYRGLSWERAGVPATVLFRDMIEFTVWEDYGLIEQFGSSARSSTQSALAEAIDEYARADGPTDDLLAEISPAAKGDLVLVLTFAGTLPQRVTVDAGAQRRAPTQPASGARGGGRGMRRAPMGGTSKTAGVVDTNLLDISASLYSIAQSRSIAMVAMQYSGASLDEAMTKFAAKLAQSLAGTLCVGWNWDAKIDPDRIRQKNDE